MSFLFISEASATPLDSQLKNQSTTGLTNSIERVRVEENKQKNTQPSSQTQIEDTIKLNSNLNYAGGTSRIRYLQIRGIGETSQYESTPNHSVQVLIDDIDVTGLTANFPSLAVDYLNIKKGTQSLQGGGFASGGILDIKLKSFLDESKNQTTFFNQINSWRGFETGILSQSKSFAASLQYTNDPSFYKNTYLNSATSYRQELSGHVKMDWLEQEKFKVQSSHIFNFSNNGYDVWTFDDSYSSLADHPGQDNLNLNGHSLKISTSIDEQFELLSTSSFTNSHALYSYDADWGNNAYWNTIPGWNKNYNYFDSFSRERNKISQSLQVSSNQIKAELGGYSLSESSDIKNFKDDKEYRGIQSQYLQTDLYAKGTLRMDLSSDIEIENSLRGDLQKTSYQSESLNKSLWAFQSQVKINISTHHELNLKYQKGFKSPGFNSNLQLPSPLLKYDEEIIDSIEAGWNYSNHYFKSTVQSFYYLRNQMQIMSSLQLDPQNPSTFSYLTTNAGRAHGYGLEMDINYVWKTWSLGSNIGLLKTEFLTYEFEGLNLAGRGFAHSPSWNYNLLLKNKITPRFSASLQSSAKDSFFYSDNNESKSPSYFLFDIILDYQIESLQLSLWCKNIFDKKYATRGFFFANEPPDWQSKLYQQWAAPQNFGASLRYVF